MPRRPIQSRAAGTSGNILGWENKPTPVAAQAKKPTSQAKEPVAKEATARAEPAKAPRTGTAPPGARKKPKEHAGKKLIPHKREEGFQLGSAVPHKEDPKHDQMSKLVRSFCGGESRATDLVEGMKHLGVEMKSDRLRILNHEEQSGNPSYKRIMSELSREPRKTPAPKATHRKEAPRAAQSSFRIGAPVEETDRPVHHGRGRVRPQTSHLGGVFSGAQYPQAEKEVGQVRKTKVSKRLRESHEAHLSSHFSLKDPTYEQAPPAEKPRAARAAPEKRITVQTESHNIIAHPESMKQADPPRVRKQAHKKGVAADRNSSSVFSQEPLHEARGKRVYNRAHECSTDIFGAPRR